MKNPLLLQRWISAIGRNNWQPTTASRVCYLHFLSSDFVNTPCIKRKILRANAIPSVNMGYNKENESNPFSDLYTAIDMREYCIKCLYSIPIIEELCKIVVD